jgi:hypothetical protein
MPSAPAQRDDVVKGNTTPVISSSITVNLITTKVTNPPVGFEYLCVIDLLSLPHDSPALGGIVALSHDTLRIK